ncbi:AAA family ATPase [Dongia deserti]|uniref:AAA family ATPase n=1 Tax=Dongia deserti TaxID=2268030 RepID=UPI000E65786D|nr:AAA family ATPase [Dongia deserti]
MLIVFSGLPGTGKTSIARELARRIRAAYLRIDTVEQALRACGTLEEIMEEGYETAYRVAKDNLELGLTVIADAVNGVEIAREAWAGVAQAASTSLINVEIICSDEREHRRRVETRSSDVSGLVLPTWEEIKNRHYQPWSRPRIRIDTAGRRVDDCVDALESELDAFGAS